MAYGKVGSLEKKVLRVLAIHPHQHAQAVQRLLDIPDRNYGAVLNSLKRLRNKGLVKYKDGISKKNNPTKLYSLTDDGVKYVLMSNPDLPTEEMNKIIENYSEDVKTQQILNKMHEVLGTKLMAKLFSTWAELGMLNSKDSNAVARMVVTSIFINGLTGEDTKRLDDYVKFFKENYPEEMKEVITFLKKRHIVS